ncbi:adapter molecule Crk-like [Tropilaelaps mercedesae]|uniref:Adapter molecule Crk-like n=1 Tax=Tropilaelaps mercedesae TaxID=418985 RepID=A0A1V9XWK9_9ACAR|nr:adapter molecule Crk-like [Tropilaelaps mercedesae]
MSRQEAIELLQRESEPGVFLVRNSNTIQGDLVLCVREETRVSHYIIHKISQGVQTRFKIGEQMFPDMPALLHFYRSHYLDTAPLIRPAAKPREAAERVRARFDFNGSGDTDDLPFRKGEVLTVISKDEDQWWTARNSLGQTGQIPVNYIERLDDNAPVALGPAVSNGNMGGHLPPPSTTPPAPPQPPSNNGTSMGAAGGPNGASSHIRYTTPQLGGINAQSNNGQPLPPGALGLNGATGGNTNGSSGGATNGQRNSQERKLPAKARVKQARVPNAYDKTALRLDQFLAVPSNSAFVSPDSRESVSAESVDTARRCTDEMVEGIGKAEHANLTRGLLLRMDFASIDPVDLMEKKGIGKAAFWATYPDLATDVHFPYREAWWMHSSLPPLPALRLFLADLL